MFGEKNGRAAVKSAMLRGCEATPVEVEVAVTSGLPGMTVVGMPDAAVLEMRERVRCAVISAGFTFPQSRVVANLAPSSMRKHGSGFDLAVAMALLVATGQVDAALAKGKLFVGELGLDGSVKSVAGMYCHALAACDGGMALVCSRDADSAALASAGCNVCTMANLADLLGTHPLARLSARQGVAQFERGVGEDVSLRGSAAALRTMQIAVAGLHPLLLIGSSEADCAELAAQMMALYPEWSHEEQRECASAWSAAWEDPAPILVGKRPFRAPHSSVTAAGLVGGSLPVRPGEVTLAHGGVLYLENVGEFRPAALQLLRLPIETGRAEIVRADGAVSMPARALVVASSRPCPCGRFGALHEECTCSAQQVTRYRDRLCGPLRDLFGICFELATEPISDKGASVEPGQYRVAVEEAWVRRAWREGHDGKPASVQAVLASCRLSDSDERWLEKVAAGEALSGRGIVDTLKVARTIADMDGRDEVRSDDLLEAMSMRLR